MAFSTFLNPRRDVLSQEGIEGIIDLANIRSASRRKLEANPDLFFRLTYPTKDIKRMIQLLDERFSSTTPTPGLFLFEGLKGTGKSHLLLLIYHLFKSTKEARGWLEQHGLSCRLPEGVIVVVNKFTDLPLLSIWDFIFEQAASRKPPKSIIQPSLSEVETGLAGRQVVLIFDELEQGIRVLPDSAIKNQNIAFLQMLSEWGNRSNQVTLFASIYSDQEEPGATLKRVPSCRVQFAQARDRARVVLHRLFENYLHFKAETVSPVVESYLNTWRRHAEFNADEYRQAMLDAYPFTPDLLDLMLHRVPARGGFQGVRGALGFLGHLVRLTHERADLIMAGDADIEDREVGTRLGDLDPGSDLITRAQANLQDLKTAPYATRIASSTLLYTLTGFDSRTHGITRDELIRNCLGVGGDINDFERGLKTFEKYAAYFHVQEGRYFFDREENADAKVEFQSIKVPEEVARDTLRKLLKEEMFRDPNAVVWSGTDEAREALESLGKDRLRWILVPRRLSTQERHALYHGLSLRNQVILLEPRDPAFDLDRHPDLLKWGKRLLAARQLVEMTRDAQRRDAYERIGREDRRHILDYIRRAGLIYVRFEAYGSRPEEDRVEEESLATAVLKEDVLLTLSQKVFPVNLLAEHLERRLEEIKGRTVAEVDREYRGTLGFPVPTHSPSLAKAIRLLCKDQKIGVYHPRGNFCGQDVGLNDHELMGAEIGETFDLRVPIPPGPGPTPPGPGPIPPFPPGGQITPPVPVFAGELVQRRIPSQSGIGALRQSLAAFLQEYPSGRVTSVRFSIFAQQSTGDLSSMATAYRGGLSGPGDLTIEVTIRKVGDFTKAQIEQMVENLPQISQAEYSVDVEIHVPPEEPPNG